VSRLLKRLRLLRRRRRLEQDLEEELRFHLEMKAEAAGNRTEAARRTGNAALLKEQCRELWTFASLETWWQDIRYAVRTLGRTPGFVVAAILALSFGIGANTAVFTIVRGALTWSLGLDHVDRVVLIEFTDAARRRSFGAAFGVSWPEFRDIASQTKAFAGLAVYQLGSVNLADDRSYPERSWRATMSASGFLTSEQKPALGRVFSESDERPGAPAVVVLSNHIWEDRYGRDPGIIGRTIRVNDVPSTVIGVMPPRKRFPEDADLWTPLVPDAQLRQRGNRSVALFARLKDGVSLAAARNELATVADRLARQYPASNKNLILNAQPIVAITGAYSMRPIFAALWAAVGFVLLIACADVANMLLARGAARRREIAVRVALGAGRFRIVRQLLIESVLLSIAGGCAGWLVALAGLRWFEAEIHTTVPVWLNLSLDRTAFIYLAVISIGCGILFGLAPAFRLTKVDVHAAMKDGGQGVAGSRRGLSLANALVALQMTLSMVLLAGAGLMIRSAVNLYGAPIGVDTANVLTMHVSLPESKYPQAGQEIAFHRALKQRLDALPGVESAAIVSRLPLGGFSMLPFEFEKGVADTDHAPVIGAIVAGPDYFRVMRVQPRRGRTFTASDGTVGPPVALVNESFVKKFSPGRDAIGKPIRIFRNKVPSEWMTVVGVVPDILQNFRAPLEHDPLIYLPYAFDPQREMYVISKSGIAPTAALDRFRAVVKQLDPNLAIYDAGTLEDSLARNRLQATLLGGMFTVFATIALALAAVGLYAVIARSIQQRTQEIGVRMALGGTRAAILKLVFAQGLGPMLIGLATGLPCALAVTRVLRTALIGVSPGDPLTFTFAVTALAIAGVLGCGVPARRALRIEPTVALRYE